MEKLVGTGNQGQFVHDNQDMAADKGFRCVSRLWYNQTIPLSEGIEKLHNAAKEREDLLVPIQHMAPAVTDNGKVVLEYIDGRQFQPTEHAWTHIAQWLGVSYQFVKDMTNDKFKQNGDLLFRRDKQDAQTLLQVLMNGHRRIERDKKFRFRTYTDGTLRSMVSEIYGIIDNRWYLETLDNLFKEIGGDEPRLSHWKGNADTIYGNLLIPDTVREESDSDYGGMLSISNCEIRKRTLSQRPSVFRAICMNGCIWDQCGGEVYKKRHRGEINLADVREAITLNLQVQIPLMKDAVTRFLQTKEFSIDKKYSMRNVFGQLAIDHSLTPSQAVSVVQEYQHEVNDRNLFGLINATTRAAQNFEPEVWVKLDESAGVMMNWNKSQFEKFLSRSQAIDNDKLERVFAAV